MSLHLKLVKNSSGARVQWLKVLKSFVNFRLTVSRGWLLGLISHEDWIENICYNTLRLPAMINTVLKFPYSKFRFNWTNISLFVPEFLPWSMSRDVRGSQRCFVNKASLSAGVAGDVLSAGLSMTYHTEMLQNKMMQTEAELQHFNVHTLVTHLVNVFSPTHMYD